MNVDRIIGVVSLFIGLAAWTNPEFFQPYPQLRLVVITIAGLMCVALLFKRYGPLGGQGGPGGGARSYGAGSIAKGGAGGRGGTGGPGGAGGNAESIGDGSQAEGGSGGDAGHNFQGGKGGGVLGGQGGDNHRPDGAHGAAPGAGGGGAGGNYPGGGGGEGARVSFTINNPVGSYEYSVGKGGAGAKSEFGNGGDGAPGSLVIQEVCDWPPSTPPNGVRALYDFDVRQGGFVGHGNLQFRTGEELVTFESDLAWGSGCGKISAWFYLPPTAHFTGLMAALVESLPAMLERQDMQRQLPEEAGCQSAPSTPVMERFTGLVYVYHDAELSTEGLQRCEALYKHKGFTLVMRGPRYLDERAASWSLAGRQYERINTIMITGDPAT